MPESAHETVADIRSAISAASDQEREAVKARYREAELQRDDPRQTVLDVTEPAEGAAGDGADGAAAAGEPPVTAGAGDGNLLTREGVIESAREVFGVSPHIAAGAMAGSHATSFSREDAAARIREFAETEHGGPDA